MTTDSSTVRRLRPEGLVRSPGFSHVAVVPPGATTVYVGGLNAVDADGTIVGDDITAQMAKVFDNLELALAAAGAGLQDVVQWRVAAVEGVDVGLGFGEFQRRWDHDTPPPLISVSVVRGLAVPGALVELDAVAVPSTTPPADTTDTTTGG